MRGQLTRPAGMFGLFRSSEARYARALNAGLIP